jgi:hypothetical protein
MSTRRAILSTAAAVATVFAMLSPNGARAALNWGTCGCVLDAQEEKVPICVVFLDPECSGDDECRC